MGSEGETVMAEGEEGLVEGGKGEEGVVEKVGAMEMEGVKVVEEEEGMEGGWEGDWEEVMGGDWGVVD